MWILPNGETIYATNSTTLRMHVLENGSLVINQALQEDEGELYFLYFHVHVGEVKFCKLWCRYRTG